MKKSRIDNSQYFNDDGDLVATSWGIEAQKKRQKEEELERKRAKAAELKSMKRYISADEKQKELYKKHQEAMEKRRIRDEWMDMPSWITSMPRTPLSDPPTEGTKEKLIYRLTRKVRLTEEEERRRKSALKRIKTAIEDYKGIHRPLPPDVGMASVAVVSLEDRIGGTMIAKAISSAMSESRRDYGNTITLDLTEDGTSFNRWYPLTQGNQVILRHVMAKLPDGLRNLTYTDIFPHASDGEFFLGNAASSHARVKLDIPGVASLYQYIQYKDSTLRNSQDVCIFNCDFRNKEALAAAVNLASAVIVVIPAQASAPYLVEEFLASLKKWVQKEEYTVLLSKIILVVSASSPGADSSKGRETLNKLVKKTASVRGLNVSRAMFIPFDRALTSPPLPWKSLKFPTAHAFRKISTYILSDIWEELHG